MLYALHWKQLEEPAVCKNAAKLHTFDDWILLKLSCVGAIAPVLELHPNKPHLFDGLQFSVFSISVAIMPAYL